MEEKRTKSVTNATVETEIEMLANRPTDAIPAAVATATGGITDEVETGKTIRGTEIETIAEREIIETQGAERDRRIIEIRNGIDIGSQDFRTMRRKSKYDINNISHVEVNNIT